MPINVTIYEGKQQRIYLDAKKLQTYDGSLWIPESEGGAAIYSRINQGFYGSVTLVNRTFVFNDSLSFLINTGSILLNFRSNNLGYTSLTATFDSGNSILKYNDTVVYNSSTGWVNDAYKTISITGGLGATDPDNIMWLLNWGQIPFTDEEKFYFDINLLCATIKKRAGWSENETIREWAIHVPT